MVEKRTVESFIEIYERDFSVEEGFPTLGKIERLDDKVYIHVNDQGFEDQEVEWLIDYFKMAGIGIEYDAMKPAIVIY